MTIQNTISTTPSSDPKKMNHGRTRPRNPKADQVPPKTSEEDVLVRCLEESGRERLKRHRAEVAGRVWIPDIWGQEELLKDWVDCSVFDAAVANNSIMSARAAMVQEGRAANLGSLRIDNRC